MTDDAPAILRCPDCGVSWLHGQAEKHAMTCKGRQFDGLPLTDAEAKVLKALYAAMPDPVSQEDLARRAVGGVRCDEWGRRMICKLRKALKGRPLEIETVCRQGYRLVLQ